MKHEIEMDMVGGDELDLACMVEVLNERGYDVYAVDCTDERTTDWISQADWDSAVAEAIRRADAQHENND